MGIDLSIEEFKQVCNLPDLHSTDMLASRYPIIDALIQEITIRRVYLSVTRKSASIVILTSFRHAFAYFLYADCIDFLNTNTSGSGIIKNTGFADSRMELLSFEETLNRQRKLELKAYELLSHYLNEKGLKRLNELKLWDDLQRAENESAKQKILSEGKRCKIALI
jgi:hypothetical protein